MFSILSEFVIIGTMFDINYFKKFHSTSEKFHIKSCDKKLIFYAYCVIYCVLNVIRCYRWPTFFYSFWTFPIIIHQKEIRQKFVSYCRLILFPLTEYFFLSMHQTLTFCMKKTYDGTYLTFGGILNRPSHYKHVLHCTDSEYK